MKAFQIWDRMQPPPEPWIGYMRKIRDMSDYYALISPVDFMGANHSPFSDLHEKIPRYLQENTNGPRMLFDAMRVRYLTLYFDFSYLDIDVELHKPLEVLTHPQKAGPGILVGNGNQEDGAKCWEYYLHMCHHFCRPASLMFPREVGVKEIPPETYTHYYQKGLYF